MYKLALASLLVTRLALADEPPAAPAPEPAAQPAPDAPAPPAEPAPVEPAAPAPAPEPAPAREPAPAPAPAVTHTSEPETPDDYYRRTRGIGIFHQARLVASALAGTAPDVAGGMMTVPGATRDLSVLSLGFDGVYLGMPSSFGNFHGIEVSAGVRSEPIDMWLTFGTAVTILNVGHGGPGSLRIGGSFGAGFNFAHAFGYLRGRAAMVLVPRRIDVEASAQWTPPSASTENYDERIMRVSLWFRPHRGSSRAYEAFVESLRRSDAAVDRERELDCIGGGIGMTLF